MPAPTVRSVVALALSSTIAPGAAAWGPTGHRTVARIAEHHLNPQAAQAVTNLLAPEQLALVATWPDEIRSEHALDDGAQRAVLLGEALRVHTQELLEVLLDEPEERGLPFPTRPVHPRTSLHAIQTAGERDRREPRTTAPRTAGRTAWDRPVSTRLRTSAAPSR
jgi:S1/P1 nuclease